jgi:hypothetical protein
MEMFVRQEQILLLAVVILSVVINLPLWQEREVEFLSVVIL